MSTPWTPTQKQAAVLAALRTRPRALAAVPTGGGKTALALTLAAEWLDADPAARLLIVTPKRLAEQDQWRHEAAKWLHTAPLASEFRTVGFDELGLTSGPVGLTFKNKAATRATLLSTPGRVWVLPWHAWTHLEGILGPRWPFSAVILDESSNLTSWSSARSRAARRTLVRSGRVDRLLLLSATPADNHSPDIACQLALLAPDEVRTLTGFQEQFCRPDKTDRRSGQVYSWVIREDARAELDALLARVVVSVPAEAALPQERVEPVTLSEPAKGFYKALEADQVASWAGSRITCGSAAVLKAKLRQVASGWVICDDEQARQVHDGKERALEAVLAGAGDEQVLIAYEWIAEREWLREAGHLDIRDPGALEAFKAGRVRTMAMHGRSAGHGLDGLQLVCRHLVFLEPPQDLETRRQVVGRLTRHGQARQVIVTTLVASGTVEEDIHASVIPRKVRRAERLVEATQIA